MLPGWIRQRIFETVARHQFVHFGAEVFVEVFDVLRQPSVFLPPLPFFGFALAQVALFFGRGIPGCQATAGSRWCRTERGSGFRCSRSVSASAQDNVRTAQVWRGFSVVRQLEFLYRRIQVSSFFRRFLTMVEKSATLNCAKSNAIIAKNKQKTNYSKQIVKINQ